MTTKLQSTISSILICLGLCQRSHGWVTVGGVSVGGTLGPLVTTPAADCHLNDDRRQGLATLANHTSSGQGVGGREGSVPGPGRCVFMAECVCVRCFESGVSSHARVSL